MTASPDKTAPTTSSGFDPYQIERPAPVLLTYYAVVCLLTGPGFPFAFVPMVCKYLTLRYKFDEKGISMSHGVLFKRETLLTYRRIQDIHLTRNLLQRWLGLATVSIQTASGAAGAEMAIEGVLEAEALRDFLYQRMRGARGLDAAAPEADAASPRIESAPDEALALLREIRDSLVALDRRREARP
jgi:uncharacterized protein